MSTKVCGRLLQSPCSREAGKEAPDSETLRCPASNHFGRLSPPLRLIDDEVFGTTGNVVLGTEDEILQGDCETLPQAFDDIIWTVPLPDEFGNLAELE